MRAAIYKSCEKAKRTLTPYSLNINGPEDAIAEAIADFMHFLDTTPLGASSIDKIVERARHYYIHEKMEA
jgi:hypothetical protein